LEVANMMSKTAALTACSSSAPPATITVCRPLTMAS
jgi:hypothetical protein